MACACTEQAGISLLMAAILVIWTAATFRQPLPTPLPDNLGINYSGLSSIAVMPISLFSASIFRWVGCSLLACLFKYSRKRGYLSYACAWTQGDNPGQLPRHGL